MGIDLFSIVCANRSTTTDVIVMRLLFETDPISGIIFQYVARACCLLVEVPHVTLDVCAIISHHLTPVLCQTQMCNGLPLFVHICSQTLHHVYL